MFQVKEWNVWMHNKRNLELPRPEYIIRGYISSKGKQCVEIGFPGSIIGAAAQLGHKK